MRELEPHHRVAFAREFRTARADALKNAEAFDQLLFALERLGSFRTRSRRHLGAYKEPVCELARESSLFEAAAAKFPQFHASFPVLYDEVRDARNDAMHQGAAARHLVRSAQEIAVIMEEALMAGAKAANKIMVPDPVCAELWRPISAIRRTTLLNAFSFLPYQDESGAWHLVSDCRLVQVLRDPSANRDDRLLLTLQDAIKDGLRETAPFKCKLTDQISDIAARITEEPCLVMSDEGRLAGIITAFDLL